MWQVFAQFMTYFWQERFENGNAIGIIDFSIAYSLFFAIHVLFILFNF